VGVEQALAQQLGPRVGAAVGLLELMPFHQVLGGQGKVHRGNLGFRASAIRSIASFYPSRDTCQNLSGMP